MPIRIGNTVLPAFRIRAGTKLVHQVYHGEELIYQNIAEPTNIRTRRDTNQLGIIVEWDTEATSEDILTAANNYDVSWRPVGSTAAWAELSNIGDSPYTIRGVVGGTMYDIRLRSKNATGASQWVSGPSAATVAAPGPVRNLRSDTTTPTQLSINWDAPTSGGHTGYHIRYGLSSSSYGTIQTLNTLATGRHLPGLTQGTRYYVQVRAFGAGGNGPWVEGTFTTAATPGNVVGLAIGTATTTTIPIMWDEPTSGSAVSDYRVEWRLNGSSGNWNNATVNQVSDESGNPSYSYTITGLTSNRGYDIRVRANGSPNNGSWTTLTNQRTVARVPSAPVLTTGRKTATTIPISWTAPTTGDVPTQYEIRWSTTSLFTNPVTKIISDPTTTQYTIGSEHTLTANALYYFQVRGSNAGGDGPWSQSSNTRLDALPDAPGNLTYSINGTDIVLDWDDARTTIGPNTGGFVSRFRIEWGTTEGSYTTHANAAYVNGNLQSTYTITGITPGTTYYVRVRAENSAGNSAWVNETVVTVDPFITQTFTIGAMAHTSNTTHNILSWDPSANLLIDSDFNDVGIDGNIYLAYFELGLGPLYSSQNIPRHAIRIATDTTNIGTGSGQELLPAWESYAEAITIEAGSLSFVLPGPNGTNGFPDINEPYFWHRTSSEQSEYETFITDYNALSTSDKNNTTLTFTFPTFSDDQIIGQVRNLVITHTFVSAGLNLDFSWDAPSSGNVRYYEYRRNQYSGSIDESHWTQWVSAGTGTTSPTQRVVASQHINSGTTYNHAVEVRAIDTNGSHSILRGTVSSVAP